MRKYKQKVVEYVESCIPEEALDMGTTVMAMQVSCKAPGCVPLETAIVIVFPKLDEELIPGLSESRGGNYKTKVLKPMAEVTQDDVLEALPPEFPGGKRSMEKLCLQARDVMLGQITQLFAEEDHQGRQLMAEYLKECLKEYTDRGCVPPEWGEPFPPLETNTNLAENENENDNSDETKRNQINNDESAALQKADLDDKKESLAGITASGNFVFKRPKEEQFSVSGSHTFVPSSRPTTGATYSAPSRNQQTSATSRTESGTKPASKKMIEQMQERQHAPGIRRPGCPCCDPENADNMIDEMMAL